MTSAESQATPMEGAPYWVGVFSSMKLAQGKLTYLGEQKKAIGTVIFSVAGCPVDMARFVAVHRTGKPYPNDQLPYTVAFEVSTLEFARVLALVEPLLAAADPGAAVDFVSFAIVAEGDEVVLAAELAVSRGECPGFYRRLAEALDPDNQPGREAILGQLGKFIPAEDFR